MVNIKKQFAKTSSRNSKGDGNGKKFITIHQTGNTNRGANAQAHANLQSNGNSRAAWHWQVDDKVAIQSFSHDKKLYHAGDGFYGVGNNHSIGIELCVNSDGNYAKTIKNAAELVRKIMKDENIPIQNVVQHNRWSGKNCPQQIRSGYSGITWNNFLSLVKGSNVKPSVNNKKPVDNLSLVDYLKSKGMNSSFSSRQKLASNNGIKNYKGTAAQNTKLLNILKNKKTTANFKKGDSVVVKKSASRYVTGEKIPGFVKGSKYEVIQTKNDRSLLGGVYSWFYNKDLQKG